MPQFPHLTSPSLTELLRNSGLMHPQPLKRCLTQGALDQCEMLVCVLSLNKEHVTNTALGASTMKEQKQSLILPHGTQSHGTEDGQSHQQGQNCNPDNPHKAEVHVLHTVHRDSFYCGKLLKIAKVMS